jgi:hypothetical protein
MAPRQRRVFQQLALFIPERNGGGAANTCDPPPFFVLPAGFAGPAPVA